MNDQPPPAISASDVEAFLSSLAVEHDVSASTQNQAFNALLFLHRHVLYRDLAAVAGMVRPRQKRRLPVYGAGLHAKTSPDSFPPSRLNSLAGPGRPRALAAPLGDAIDRKRCIMPQRSRGIRSKTRYTLQKRPRDRGRPAPNRVLADFAVGTKVAVKAEPSQHGGMAHARFQGLTGTVQGRQGEAFVVAVRHGDKPKTLVVRPEHLRTVG